MSRWTVVRGGVVAGALALGLGLATPAAGGVVVLESGEVLVGRIRADDVSESFITVRWPHQAETRRGEIRIQRERVRWFDREADAPTDEYWAAFLVHQIDPRWEAGRAAYAARHPGELARARHALAREKVAEAEPALATARADHARGAATDDELRGAEADLEGARRELAASESALRALEPRIDEATIVTRSGRRLSGELLSYAEGTYRLRVNGGVISLRASEVARIELAPAPAGPSGRVTLDVREGQLGDVVAAIAAQGGREVVVAPGAAGIVVSARMEGRPWEEALEEVARLARCRVELQGGKLCVVVVARDVLAQGVIDLVAHDEALSAVVERIGRQVGINVLVDPAVEERVTVDLRQIPWRDALQLVARMCKCRLEERAGGVLVITQPPRVTLQFTNADVRTILQLLAAYSGKNIVLDSEVRGEVTLDMKEMDWDLALLSICRTCGLHARVMGDVVSVTARPSNEGEPLRVPGSAAPQDAGAVDAETQGRIASALRSLLAGEEGARDRLVAPLPYAKRKDDGDQWSFLSARDLDAMFDALRRRTPEEARTRVIRDAEWCASFAEPEVSRVLPLGGYRVVVLRRPDTPEPLFVYLDRDLQVRAMIETD